MLIRADRHGTEVGMFHLEKASAWIWLYDKKTDQTHTWKWSTQKESVSLELEREFELAIKTWTPANAISRPIRKHTVETCMQEMLKDDNDSNPAKKALSTFVWIVYKNYNPQAARLEHIWRQQQTVEIADIRTMYEMLQKAKSSIEPIDINELDSPIHEIQYTP